MVVISKETRKDNSKENSKNNDKNSDKNDSIIIVMMVVKIT